MADDFQIRPFETTDERAVVALWMDCGLVVPHNNPGRDIQRKLQVNPEWFLIGEEKGEVVATCMAGYEGHRGWINYLAVIPGRRRHGLGGRMLAEAERLLLLAGCPKVNLQIRPTNTGVIPFYEALGFTVEPAISLGKRLIPDVASG